MRLKPLVPNSDIHDLGDLTLAHSARNLYSDNVSSVFTDVDASNRRVDRNLADLDVRFVVADDLAGHDLLEIHVFQRNRSAKHTATIGIEQVGIDSLGVGELALDFDRCALFSTTWLTIRYKLSKFFTLPVAPQHST